MTILRTELVTVSTNGPLEVRGDDFDTALFVGGQPVAYFWSDFAGSVGQNLIRTISPNPTEAIQRFRDSVSGSDSLARTLVDSFPELVSILVAGEYKLELEELPPDTYVVDFSFGDKSGGISNFYPGFGALVATQPRSSLSEQIIRDYDRRIADGARPLVVTLAGGISWAEFVIDGHHKLQAYRRSGISIHRLAIIKLNPQPVKLSDVLGLIPDDDAEKAKLLANKPQAG